MKFFKIITTALLLLISHGVLASENILILHSYHQEYPWTKKQHTGFIDTLNSSLSGSAIISVEYLDNKRNSYTNDYQLFFLEYLHKKYKKYSPDLIYVTDDNALDFIINHHQRLFPDVPVIFSGINDLHIKDKIRSKYIKGILEKKDIETNLELFRHLFPRDKKLIILGDGSLTFRLILDDISKTIKNNYPDMTFEIISANNMDELEKKIRIAGEGNILLTTIGGISQSGILASINEIIQIIGKSGNFRLVSMEDVYITENVIGGFVTNGYIQGSEAGKLALLYFRDKHLFAEQPVTTEGQNKYIFNQIELNKNRIFLPASIKDNAIIINKELSFIEAHPEIAIGILLFLVFALLLLLLVLFIMANNRNADIQVKNLDLKNKQKEIETHLKFLNTYKNILDKVNLLMITDETGTITLVNDKLLEASAYEKSELIGQSYKILNHPDVKAATDTDLWDHMRSFKMWKSSLKNITKFREEFYTKTTAIPLADSDNRLYEIYFVSTEITQLIQQEEIIRHQTVDALTEFNNRIRLLEDIAHSDHNLLAIINVDNYKDINEFFGIEGGDAIIVQVAFKLHSLMEKSTYKLYRTTGDEFGILQQNSDELNSFEDKIEGLLQSLSEESYIYKDNIIHMAFTAGIATGKDQILRNADMALKRAKHTNSNYSIYDASANYSLVTENNIIWTRKVKSALRRDHIIPYFQPILNNHNGKIEKYEMLMRLRDEEGHIITPLDFLSIAKKSRQYSFLTRKMLEKSVEIIQSHDYNFSLNLSVEDILDVSTVNFITDMMTEQNIASRLILEITESEGIESYKEVISFINKMKSHGARIAIDDFGTGYSNFIYLLRLNADFIKIDGSIIKNITTDKNSYLIAKMITEYSRESGFQTIAEYVNSEEVLNAVKELGINFSQGFYIGEPIPPEQL